MLDLVTSALKTSMILTLVSTDMSLDAPLTNPSHNDCDDCNDCDDRDDRDDRDETRRP
jgi:hypothetical protein